MAKIHPNIADTVNSFIIDQANIWTKITKHQTHGKSQWLLVNLNQWIYQSKLKKRFSFRWTNSFATFRSRILSVLALWVCNKATLLKRCCFMLARNHAFTLLAMENDRSPVALVAGFTNRSLQITITSVIMCLLWSVKTLNRFQNIGKAINLRILDQHFQTFGHSL